jgi:hypothetical protein
MNRQNLLKHADLLIFIITLVGGGIIAVSVKVFGNPYYDTVWHWSLAFLFGGIIVMLTMLKNEQPPTLPGSG